LVPCTAAVHHHPGVGTGAVEDAVLDEVTCLVQHAGVGALAGVDLGDIARGRLVKDGGGVGSGEVELLEPRHIHEPSFRADGDMIERHVVGIGPRRAHAVPILELRAERAMTISENRCAPTQCHMSLLTVALPGSAQLRICARSAAANSKISATTP